MRLRRRKTRGKEKEREMKREGEKKEREQHKEGVVEMQKGGLQYIQVLQED